MILVRPFLPMGLGAYKAKMAFHWSPTLLRDHIQALGSCTFLPKEHQVCFQGLCRPLPWIHFLKTNCAVHVHSFSWRMVCGPAMGDCLQEFGQSLAMWAAAPTCISIRPIVIQDGTKGVMRRGIGQLKTRGAGSLCASFSQCRTLRNPKILNVNLAYQVVSKVYLSR